MKPTTGSVSTTAIGTAWTTNTWNALIVVLTRSLLDWPGCSYRHGRTVSMSGRTTSELRPAWVGYALDSKLITTPLRSRGGIEPCDIFVAPNVLIHVKRGRSSADLSHLLAQALISFDFG